MPIFLEALIFGVAVAFMLVGLIGIVVPILPGTIFIWLGVLAFALVEGFTFAFGQRKTSFREERDSETKRRRDHRCSGGRGFGQTGERNCAKAGDDRC